MSGTPQWNRAAMQRRELGPMLHDYGTVIYDQAEQIALQEIAAESLMPPTSLPDLAQLARADIRAIESARMGVPSPGTERVAANMDFALAVQQLDNTAGNKLISIPYSLLIEEALASGVIVPLQLYKTIKLFEAEKSDSKGYILPEEIGVDAEEAVKRIGSQDFQQMLHQLAIGENGSLGAASTQTDYLITASAFDRRTFSLLDGFSGDDIFEFNSAGQITGFTELLLSYQKTRKLLARHEGGAERVTGGCPVRHATFPAIGEVATNYLREAGDEDGQPRNQGESLIARASRFVAATLAARLQNAEASS